MLRRVNQLLHTRIASDRAANRVFNGIIMVFGPLMAAVDLHDAMQHSSHGVFNLGLLISLAIGVWALVLWVGFFQRRLGGRKQSRFRGWPPPACPRCKYDLRTCTSDTCPECGYWLALRRRDTGVDKAAE